MGGTLAIKKNDKNLNLINAIEVNISFYKVIN